VLANVGKSVVKHAYSPVVVIILTVILRPFEKDRAGIKPPPEAIDLKACTGSPLNC